MDEMYVWIIMGALMSGILILVINNDKFKKDINRMNKTLNRIAEKVGATDEINAELKGVLLELISKGEKFKAIKEYRIATGTDLLEAKEYVDDLCEEKLN